MQFISGFSSSAVVTEPAWWFAFRDDKLLIQSNGDLDDTPQIPFHDGLEVLNLQPVRRHYLGTLDGASCYAVQIARDAVAPHGMLFKAVRELFGRLPDALVGLAGRANQILRWDEAHQFCGRCGGVMESKQDERAKNCPACDLINYPRISPAIIVAVIKKDRILLARSTRFAARFYSVLAGFVEPGESLEECVIREVKEEVGVRVKDIRYFGSQPWPFPDSLMVGFTATYEEGDLILDEKEIMDAGWFSPDDLPQVPGKFSIAGLLIDWFVREQTQT